MCVRQAASDVPMIDADRSSIGARAYWDFVRGLRHIQQLEVMLLRPSLCVLPPALPACRWLGASPGSGPILCATEWRKGWLAPAD